MDSWLSGIHHASDVFLLVVMDMFVSPYMCMNKRKKRNQQQMIYYVYACTHAIVKFLNQGGHVICWHKLKSERQAFMCMCAKIFSLAETSQMLLRELLLQSWQRNLHLQEKEDTVVANSILHLQVKEAVVEYLVHPKVFNTSRYALISCEEGATTPPWITKKSFVFSGTIR